MISLFHLWLPILLSAGLVFVASSLVHMVFKWHAADYHGLGNEDEVREAIRKGNPSPGQYVIPYCAEMKDMGSPAMQEKYTEGPAAFLVTRANGVPAMGLALGLWFLFSVGVSLASAYVASRSLAPGIPHAYLQVFRITGTVAFLTYAGGAFPAMIWMGKPWRSGLKDILDGLIYALLTAGTFGWLWPR